MLDWGESGAALSHFPQGRAAFFGQFSPRSSIFTPLPLWAPLVVRWSPCRPPALASARPLGCSRTEPQREQLVMSKSCQEKRQIPPRGFGCSSPRCCWLADGGGQQLGWWLGCSLLPCQSLGLFLRWLPWGRRCLFERTRGSLINLPRGPLSVTFLLCWRQSKGGAWGRCLLLPPRAGIPAILHPSQTRYGLAGGQRSIPVSPLKQCV